MSANWLREPFLHFIILGALVFGLYGLTAKGSWRQADREINISTAAINQLREQWRAQNGTLPDQATLHRLIESLIRQQVLLKEAKHLGLGDNDTIVRRRLIQKMEFLSANLAQLHTPTDTILRAYYAAHREHYRVAEKRSFTHIYFSKEKRGAAVEADARALLSKLARDDAPLRAPQLGDNFILQYDYRDRSQKQLAQVFGADFARVLFSINTEQWQGPILSAYGAHLVRVGHVAASFIPAFDEIKSRVMAEVMTKQLAKLKEQSYRQIRSHYQIHVDSPATGKAS